MCVYLTTYFHVLVSARIDTFTHYTRVGPFLTPPIVDLHFHMTVVGWMLEALDNE